MATKKSPAGRERSRHKAAESYGANDSGERFNYWTMVDPTAAKDELGHIMLSFLHDLDGQPLHGLRKRVIALTREMVSTLTDDQGYYRLKKLIDEPQCSEKRAKKKGVAVKVCSQISDTPTATPVNRAKVQPY